MRRIDREVSIEEAWRFLSEAEHGVLSVCEGDIPYGIPLNYCVVNSNLYFHCALEGRKIEVIKSNPHASFCAVKSTRLLPSLFSTAYESVIVSGILHEVYNEEKIDALVGLIKKYSQEFYDKGLKYVQTSADSTRVFKLNITEIAGKSRR